jgi:hypothetical protein
MCYCSQDDPGTHCLLTKRTVDLFLQRTKPSTDLHGHLLRRGDSQPSDTLNRRECKSIGR